MKTRHYRDDFDFILSLADCDGNPLPWPEYNWEGRMWTLSPDKAFTFGVKEGVPFNCFNDNGRIHVVADNHGLTPGEVMLEFTARIPSDIYPDGSQTVERRCSLGVTLTACTGHCVPHSFEVDIRLPVVAIHDDSSYSRDEVDALLQPRTLDGIIDTAAQAEGQSAVGLVRKGILFVRDRGCFMDFDGAAGTLTPAGAPYNQEVTYTIPGSGEEVTVTEACPGKTYMQSRMMLHEGGTPTAYIVIPAFDPTNPAGHTPPALGSFHISGSEDDPLSPQSLRNGFASLSRAICGVQAIPVLQARYSFSDESPEAEAWRQNALEKYNGVYVFDNFGIWKRPRSGKWVEIPSIAANIEMWRHSGRLLVDVGTGDIYEPELDYLGGLASFSLDHTLPDKVEYISDKQLMFTPEIAEALSVTYDVATDEEGNIDKTQTQANRDAILAALINGRLATDIPNPAYCIDLVENELYTIRFGMDPATLLVTYDRLIREEPEPGKLYVTDFGLTRATRYMRNPRLDAMVSDTLTEIPSLIEAGKLNLWPATDSEVNAAVDDAFTAAMGYLPGMAESTSPSLPVAPPSLVG